MFMFSSKATSVNKDVAAAGATAQKRNIKMSLEKTVATTIQKVMRGLRLNGIEHQTRPKALIMVSRNGTGTMQHAKINALMQAVHKATFKQ